jgi:Site-specific recombinase XerD
MGQKKTPKGEVSISNCDGRIRLRWRYQGKRYSMNMPYPYTPENLQNSADIAKVIKNDILSGTFDSTLSRYEKASVKKPVQAPVVQATENIADLLEPYKTWVKAVRNSNLDTTYYRVVYKFLSRAADKTIGDIPELLQSQPWKPVTYNSRVTCLRQFFTWLYNKKMVPDNPIADVRNRKVSRLDKNPKREPMSEEDIVRALKAIRTDEFYPSGKWKHSHYFPFLAFLVMTGVRPSEAVGLRVKHVSLKNNTILIEEVMAPTVKGTNPSARIRKETKTGNRRVLTMTPILKKLLEKQVKGRASDDFVFPSPKGLCLDSRQFGARIFQPVLKKLGMADKVLYNFRHGFGTRLAKSGTLPIEIAYLMGHATMRTTMEHYIHIDHTPVALPKIRGMSLN